MSILAQKMGVICIIAGIIVILTRVFMWVFYDRFMPTEWGGRSLLIVGTALFGACGITDILSKRNK